ncbi:phage tail tip lysozyme [Peribacillus frigoritolerans]|uniref:phage tail tip lysozyme n=1 Tax=Peribacillus frigoritolerans TaxID=450367 RepID=UPI003F84FB16
MACKISALGAVIAAEIGQTETPVDKTKYGKWYGQDGQYWCDMFQAWCANQVGATDICGKFAYTPYHSEFFKKKGAWYRTPKKGDYAFFHNGERICHIGWVEKVIDSNTVQTIEGNTGSSSNANGGQVLRRKRSISGTPTWKIVGFGRPAYLDEAAGGPVNTNPQMQKYTVQPNDSLWKIAETYQVNFDDLIKENPDIHDPNILQVGQVINLPNARGPLNVPPQVHTHTVQQGEDFWKIAKTYQVNFDDLIKENPDIHDPNILQVGQVINLPNARGPLNVPPQVHTHTVQQGEDFWKIAEKYQVNFEDLIKANPDIHNPNNLRVGEVINLPNARGDNNRPPGNGPIPSAPAGTVRYRVHHTKISQRQTKREDIEKIAKKFDIKSTAITKLNPKIKKIPDEGTMINIPIKIESRPFIIKSIHEEVWNFFINKGFSATATAGIMGNLQQESEMDPNKRQYKGGPALGIGQWEPERWSRLEKAAGNNKEKAKNLYFQLEYILKELQIEKVWVGAKYLRDFGGYEVLKKMDIYEAVVAFECSFELAGDPRFPWRFAFADAIYRRFARDVRRVRA